jgi:hypothetical protein
MKKPLDSHSSYQLTGYQESHLKANSAVTEEFLKATSTDINRLLKANGNLLNKTGKIANPSSFWKPFSTVWVPQLSETLL